MPRDDRLWYCSKQRHERRKVNEVLVLISTTRLKGVSWCRLAWLHITLQTIWCDGTFWSSYVYYLLTGCKLAHRSTNSFWQGVFRRMNARLGTTTAYHPNEDGISGKLDSYPTLSCMMNGAYLTMLIWPQMCHNSRVAERTRSFQNDINRQGAWGKDITIWSLQPWDHTQYWSLQKGSKNHIGRPSHTLWSTTSLTIWETGQVISSSQVFTHNQREMMESLALPSFETLELRWCLSPTKCWNLILAVILDEDYPEAS